MSRQFIVSIEEREGRGKSVMKPAVKGQFYAANPRNSDVSPDGSDRLMLGSAGLRTSQSGISGNILGW